MDQLQGGKCRKHDVPLEHLDFKYIESCTQVKELEKIVKILRSGEEGRFPELEKFAEDKLESLNPKSRILRKDQPPATQSSFDKNEWNDLQDDLKSWTTKMNQNGGFSSGSQNSPRVPPIRQQDANSFNSTAEQGLKKPKASKCVPRDYREWDKVDIESELTKIDESKSEKKTVEKNKAELSSCVDTSGLSSSQRLKKSELEKDKGNEAFRASDFDESIVYYTRSIAYSPSVASHNNRAQAYVKLKKWDEALQDCAVVLELEPNNLKGLLRRAVAHEGKRDYVSAKKDLQKVLMTDPSNKKAEELFKQVSSKLDEQKTKGRRMVIEEVSEDDDDSESFGSADEEEEEEDSTPTSNLNGHHPPSTSNSEPMSDFKNNPASLPNGEIPSTDLPNDHASDLKLTPEQSAKPEPRLVSEKVNGTTEPVDNQRSNSSIAPPKLREIPPLPKNIILLREKATSYFKTGRYGEAIVEYTDIIKKLSANKEQTYNLALMYSNRGLCKSKIGDLSGCVVDSTTSLNLIPGALKPLIRRAQAYENLEKYREAYVDYRQALAYENGLETVYQGSNRCMKILKEQDGKHWREKLPRSDPQPNLYSHYAQPLLNNLSNGSQQIPTDTSRNVTSAADNISTSAQNLNDSSNKENRNEGLNGTQQPKVQTTKNKKPSKEQLDFEKFKNQGNDHVKKGDYKRAVICYNLCITACPQNPVGYTNRALCHLKLGRHANVVQDCQMALQLDSKNIKALFRRGQAFKELNDYKSSRKDLEKVLQCDPGNAAAKKELEMVIKLAVDEAKLKSSKCKNNDCFAKKSRVIDGIESSSDEESNHKNCRNCTNELKSSASPRTNSNLTAAGESKKNHVKPSKKERQQKSERPKVTPTPAPPVLNRVTPYEFMHAWSSLKSSADFNHYRLLLIQIMPKELPTVISNKLDGPMLSILLKCVRLIIEDDKANLGYHYLFHIRKISRFNMVSMFMDAADKKEFNEIIASLRHSGIAQDLLDQLIKDYLI